MLRLSSLSTRLIIAVVATATVAFAASFGLTIVRLDQGLERQAEQLSKLSEEKLGQRLDGDWLEVNTPDQIVEAEAFLRDEGLAA